MCWELVPIPFKVRIWKQTGLKIILRFPTTVMLLLLFSLPVQDVYKTEMHPTEKCAKNEKSYILESLNILTTWFVYNYSRGTDLTSILRWPPHHPFCAFYSNTGLDLFVAFSKLGFWNPPPFSFGAQALFLPSRVTFRLSFTFSLKIEFFPFPFPHLFLKQCYYVIPS